MTATTRLAPEPGDELAQTLPTVPRRPVVLVIDDEARVRTLLNVALRQHGFAVKLAASGAEAMNVYRECQCQVDLVLLDVLMPEMDGPQTLAALREINRKVRCCFLTGTRTVTDDELRRLGAARVFRKPLQIAELVQSLWLLVANVKEETATPPQAELLAAPGAPPEAERRTRVRYLCHLQGACQQVGQPTTAERWLGELQDISKSGVRVVIGLRFEVGTLLVIELPVRPSNSTHILLARVVHVAHEGIASWSHGCAFTNHLTDSDLKSLIA